MSYFSGDSEGEALSDWLEDGEDYGERYSDDVEVDHNGWDVVEDKAEGLREQHRLNAAQRVGTVMYCAYCGVKMVKKSYQSQFCSNKGAGNCKDRYWNTVDVRKRMWKT